MQLIAAILGIHYNGVYMVMVKSAVPVFLLHGDPVVAERPASRGGPQEGG